MTDEEIKELLLKDVLQDPSQPYVLYYKNKDKILFYKNDGLGIINPGNGMNTTFRLASVSKQFVAKLILSLVREDKLKLEDAITKYYPCFPSSYQDITIKNLLNHTSGILDYEDYLENEYSLTHQIKDEDIIPFLIAHNETYFKPGTKYRYSNTAFILLANLASKITNKTIQEALKYYVFDKALMKDTAAYSIDNFDIKNWAKGHVVEKGEAVLKDQYWCSATIGDGGIYSNIQDLNKWIDYLESHFDELKDTMFKPNILEDGTNTCYGLGMRIFDYGSDVIYTHSGETIGTNTILLFSGKKDIRVIFLTNLGNTKIDHIRENIKELM